ncbi:MAG: DUF2064 domain-containing protein [Bacteroidota bacterium]
MAFELMSHSTAILLFSHSSSVEERLKWSIGNQYDLSVSNHLIKRAEQLCKQSGLDYFRSDESTQVGETFGHKIAHAISEIFARGYQHLIVVGNDCPELRVSDLRKCDKKLQQGAQVLGPDRRGGVYLLGLQSATFDADVFANLSWQQPQLHSQLSVLFQDAHSLRSLSDLNSIAELRDQISCISGFRIWSVLRAALTAISGLGSVFFFWTSAGGGHITYRRGPPVLS